MAATGVLFRSYRDDDRDAVWSVFAATTAQLGFTNGPWDDDMRSIPHTYLDSGGEFLVGELDGVIVAHAAFLRDPEGRARVRRVAVHPSVQRRDIGRALMAALEVRACERGITMLQLDTSLGQIAAQALYRTCGYRKVGHIVLSGVTCILYGKHLDPSSGGMNKS
jgi:ribosomal protein S18 acetylase RimI-like enzyme